MIVQKITQLYESELLSDQLIKVQPCFESGNIEHLSAFKNIEHSLWLTVTYFFFVYPLVICLFFIF